MVYRSDLNSTFSALSDPTRRAILNRLTAGEAAVTQLATGYTISLPAFLKHVRVLEEAGLVETRKVGRVRYCRHRPEQLLAAEQWIQEHRTFWERQLQQLDRFLTTDHTREGPS